MVLLFVNFFFDNENGLVLFKEDRLLLPAEVLYHAHVVIQPLHFEVTAALHIFANGVRQDELAAQAVALVEVFSVPQELAHGFYEACLRFGVSVLHPVFICHFFLQCLLQRRIFLKCRHQFVFVFLDNPPTHLF